MPTETAVQKLTRARYMAGLSQQGLADKAGVSPTTVASYEQGHSTPRGQTLVKLATALGIDPDEVLDAMEASA